MNLLTPEQLAAELGQSLSAITRLRNRGIITDEETGNRSVRYDLPTVREQLRNHADKHSTRRNRTDRALNRPTTNIVNFEKHA